MALALRALAATARIGYLSDRSTSALSSANFAVQNLILGSAGGRDRIKMIEAVEKEGFTVQWEGKDPMVRWIPETARYQPSPRITDSADAAHAD